MFDSVPPNLPTTDTPPIKPPVTPPTPLPSAGAPTVSAPIVSPRATPSSLPSGATVSPASLQEEHVTVMPSKFFVPPKARLPWKKIGLVTLVTVVIGSGIVGVTYIVKDRIRPEQRPSTPSEPVATAPVSPPSSTTPPPPTTPPSNTPNGSTSTGTPPPSEPVPPSTSQPPTTPPATPPTGSTVIEPEKTDRALTSAPDRDTDGLGDEEEVVLGTDAAVADTDGDGFADGKEIGNLFSPNSPEPAKKLWETNVVNKYHHPTLGYELLYPSAWVARSTTSDGQEIVFAAATGASIIVTATPNTERLTPAQWYAKQYPASGAATPITTKSGLTGAVSPTGLMTVFAVGGSGADWMIRFQYLATASPVATYKSLYQAMVSSFQLPATKAFWPF